MLLVFKKMKVLNFAAFTKIEIPSSAVLLLLVAVQEFSVSGAQTSISPGAVGEVGVFV